MSDKIRITKQEFNEFTNNIQEIKCYVEVLKYECTSFELEKIQKIAKDRLIKIFRGVKDDNISLILITLQTEWLLMKNDNED